MVPGHTIAAAMGALTLGLATPDDRVKMPQPQQNSAMVTITVPAADLERCRETLGQVLAAPARDARTVRAAGPGLPQARCVAE